MYSTKHNLEDIMGKRNRGLEQKRRMPRNTEKLQNLCEGKLETISEGQRVALNTWKRNGRASPVPRQVDNIITEVSNSGGLG